MQQQIRAQVQRRIPTGTLQGHSNPHRALLQIARPVVSTTEILRVGLRRGLLWGCGSAINGPLHDQFCIQSHDELRKMFDSALFDGIGDQDLTDTLFIAWRTTPQ